MSPKLPTISGQVAVRAFQCLGYDGIRQRGRQIRLRHPLDPCRKPLTVPNPRTLKPGLLRKLIRDARLDVEEFIRLL